MSDSRKIKILYIDDEANNLHSFKAMFRHDYEVLLAGSGKEGLGVVEKHPDIKVIFCDQRMPEQTGVEFFQEVSQRFPEPVRMLITGYVDIDAVIDAINHGHIYRYLTKPWREEEVRSAIEEGYKFYVTSSLLSIKVRELQEANEELDKFTYSVTHDIRGPIVSILGALQILQSLDDVAEMKELAQMMVQSAEKVKNLIANIHAYHNLKRGNLNIQEVWFTGLLEEVVGLHGVEANLNDIDIRVNVSQNAPFHNDVTVLQLILNNLITNSIKYQQKHESAKFVSIDVRVAGGAAEIVIEDNGIGIDPQYLPKVFELFFRATNEGVGSGFGLYNVRDALSKLKGTIDVKSEVGVGTRFEVRIPTQ